jgi:hypothetical protein
LAAGLGALLSAAGCGGGNLAGEVAKPPEFAPKDQAKCGVTKSQARPLIVEWPSSDRATLEARLKQGVVPVRYIGCEMEVLSRCQVPKSRYSYTGLTRKSDRIVMRDADELYANIPVYAAKFEGKLQRSGALTVDMTIVGRYEADQSSVQTADLAGGDCEGATHVISALTVGAFEFFAGAEAEAGAGVEAFGAGAGGKTTSQRETLNRDGDGAACDKAKAEDNTPPFGCGALLRVEVVPLGTGGAAAGAAAPAPSPAASAEPPTAKPPNAAPTPMCTTGDAPGCAAACDAGQLKACVQAGEIFYNVEPKDPPRAAKLFQKACDGGEPTGCVDLGWAYSAGLGVPKDYAASAASFGKACTGTVAAGCLGLGQLYRDGKGVPQSSKRAAELFKKACDGGVTVACKMVPASRETEK